MIPYVMSAISPPKPHPGRAFRPRTDKDQPLPLLSLPASSLVSNLARLLGENNLFAHVPPRKIPATFRTPLSRYVHACTTCSAQSPSKVCPCS